MDVALFKDEVIELRIRPEKDIAQLSNEDINEKYLKGEVRIITEQARYPLDTIKTMLDSKKYKLDPEFQRRHRWTQGQKSRLIESFIMNVPIPPIFLYEVSYSNYEVMDGLQRLTAIYEFYNDKYELKELEYWKELEGRKYSTLPEQVKSGVDRRYLSSIILLKETAKTKEAEKQLKQIVFERINSGGTKLEYQESRNALYSGRFNELCIKLARNTFFCKIFGIPEPTEEEILHNIISDKLEENNMYSKMRDVEAVMRFFAMRHVDKYNGRQKEYFDLFTESANKLPDTVLALYASLFEKTIELAYNLFGESAFGNWREKEGEWIFNSYPNLFIYDPMMVVLSKYADQPDQLLNKKNAINADRKKLFLNNAILTDGRQTSKSAIEQRMEVINDFFNSFL